MMRDYLYNHNIFFRVNIDLDHYIGINMADILHIMVDSICYHLDVNFLKKSILIIRYIWTSL